MNIVSKDLTKDNINGLFVTHMFFQMKMHCQDVNDKNCGQIKTL